MLCAETPAIKSGARLSAERQGIAKTIVGDIGSRCILAFQSSISGNCAAMNNVQRAPFCFSRKTQGLNAGQNCLFRRIRVDKVLWTSTSTASPTRRATKSVKVPPASIPRKILSVSN